MRATIRNLVLRLRERERVDDRGRSCPSRKRGEMLEIDCMGCQGKGDLTSPRCLRGVLEVMAVESGIGSVMLAGDWESLYSGECVGALLSLSGLLRHCQDMSRKEARFGICHTCQLSPGDFYSRVASGFPEIPGLGEVPHHDNSLPKYQGACEECRRRTISDLDHLHHELSAIGRSIAQHAFHIVGDAND